MGMQQRRQQQQATPQPQPAPAKTHSKRNRPPAMALAWAIDEYERDLRRNGIEVKTIRDYHKVLRLALGCWEQHLGRAPTLDDFTVRLGEGTSPQRSPGWRTGQDTRSAVSVVLWQRSTTHKGGHHRQRQVRPSAMSAHETVATEPS
jgi:hypothetical protein